MSARLASVLCLESALWSAILAEAAHGFREEEHPLDRRFAAAAGGLLGVAALLWFWSRLA